MKKILLATSTALLVLSASGASAGDSVTISKAQFNKLVKRVAELEKATKSSTDKGLGLKIQMKPSPKIESADGEFSFQPFGRLHVDQTWFGDDLHDHGDNSDVRRARLGFKGKLAKDWKYKIELDFGSEASNVKDTHIAYTGLKSLTGLKKTTLKVGNFKPFQSMGNLTSTNYAEFIEESPAVNVFTRDESIGAGLQLADSNWSFSLGAFGADVGVDDQDDDEQWSLDTRATIAPINEKGRYLHLGASASLRTPGAENDSVRFRTRGGTVSGDRLVDTGTINNVDEYLVYGAELAGVYGPLSLQSEILFTDVETNGASDPSFTSWYAQAGWFITGESRPYDAASGTFKRVKPKSPFSLTDGGLGAWELAFRYSNVDLNDGNVTGGELDLYTIGLNWHVSNHVRFMLDYSQAETDANAVVPNDEPNIVLLRAQVDF